MEAGKNVEELFTKIKDQTFSAVYSVTDDFDPTYMEKQKFSDYDYSHMAALTYDFNDYLHTGKDGLGFTNYDKGWQMSTTEESIMHVIFSPELKLKDNKGKTTRVKPVSDSTYKDVFVAGDNKLFDYWDSLANQTVREVDGVKVDWKKE